MADPISKLTTTDRGSLRVEIDGRWPLADFRRFLDRIESAYVEGRSLVVLAEFPDTAEFLAGPLDKMLIASGEDYLQRQEEIGSAFANLGERRLGSLELRSVSYSSPGWVEVVGAWNPLKVIADLILLWRHQNEAREEARRAFQLELMDRMRPDLRERYAARLLDETSALCNLIAQDQRVGKITVIRLDE